MSVGIPRLQSPPLGIRRQNFVPGRLCFDGGEAGDQIVYNNEHAHSVRVCIYVCICLYIHIYIYLCMYIYFFVSIYTFVQIYPPTRLQQGERVREEIASSKGQQGAKRDYRQQGPRSKKQGEGAVSSFGSRAFRSLAAGKFSSFGSRAFRSLAAGKFSSFGSCAFRSLAAGKRKRQLATCPFRKQR